MVPNGLTFVDSRMIYCPHGYVCNKKAVWRHIVQPQLIEKDYQTIYCQSMFMFMRVHQHLGADKIEPTLRPYERCISRFSMLCRILDTTHSQASWTQPKHEKVCRVCTNCVGHGLVLFHCVAVEHFLFCCIIWLLRSWFLL